MKFSHKHYAPIIKSKRGELWALAHLQDATRHWLTPVIEIHSPNNKTVAQHLLAVFKQIANAWPPHLPLYLDTIWLRDLGMTTTQVTAIYEAARSHQIQFIPVIHLTDGPNSLDAAKDAMQLDQRGVLLRLKSNEVASPAIDGVLNYMGTQATQVDLLIDFGKQSMSLPDVLPVTRHLQQWRNLISSSGVFPNSLMSLPTNAWNSVPRNCWLTWEQPVLSGSLPRNPAFSDYTTRSPGPAPTFGMPSSNVRYAVADNWQTQMRGKLKGGGGADMQPICASLITQPFYRGPQFSEGDDIFSQVASGQLSTGGSTEWVQWSANHHLELVAKQIHNHSGL
ncbi:beta family protein [Planctomicrobium piriforme]|uniref:Beta protein n=1 Tax=Planctomicrobium piriforme TaxID=1576369 RepID=A0A1I3FXE8_9PLAN|nr:beta family protein [Planctomicrobium piriforme]SFI15752.1 Beta protein [Planctomicrobium piriforme]